MRQLFSMVVALLASALTAGCAQSDCERACEATKECPAAPSVFESLPCDDACDFQEEQSESAGCLVEWDAFNACAAANLDRACEGGTCGNEALAWSDCLDPDDGS